MAVATYQAWGDAIAQVLTAAGMSQSELARRLRDRGYRVDASKVSKWARGVDLPPHVGMFPAIEDETGATRGTIFRAVGYVVDDPGDVAAVINADPDLNDSAKRILIGAYKESLNLAASAATDPLRAPSDRMKSDSPRT